MHEPMQSNQKIDLKITCLGRAPSNHQCVFYTIWMDPSLATFLSTTNSKVRFFFVPQFLSLIPQSSITIKDTDCVTVINIYSFVPTGRLRCSI